MRAAPTLRARLQLPPGRGNILVGEEHSHVALPVGKIGKPARASIPQDGPLGQFADRDEGNENGLARKPGTGTVGKSLTEDA